MRHRCTHLVGSAFPFQVVLTSYVMCSLPTETVSRRIMSQSHFTNTFEPHKKWYTTQYEYRHLPSFVVSEGDSAQRSGARERKMRQIFCIISAQLRRYLTEWDISQVFHLISSDEPRPLALQRFDEMGTFWICSIRVCHCRCRFNL